jgi:hypothetical protein
VDKIFLLGNYGTPLAVRTLHRGLLLFLLPVKLPLVELDQTRLRVLDVDHGQALEIESQQLVDYFVFQLKQVEVLADQSLHFLDCCLGSILVEQKQPFEKLELHTGVNLGLLGKRASPAVTVS